MVEERHGREEKCLNEIWFGFLKYGKYQTFEKVEMIA